MDYNQCDWCRQVFDLGTEYILIDDEERCCLECWYNFGIKDLIDLHGDPYEYVSD